MNEKAEDLKKRTATFARRVADLCERLPRTDAGRTASAQLTDAATSVSANYRACCRARSKKEFTAKIGQVEEEADECVWWLEFIRDKGLLSAREIASELDEARQLTAIFTASHRTARGRARLPDDRRKQSPPIASARDQSSIPE